MAFHENRELTRIPAAAVRGHLVAPLSLLYRPTAAFADKKHLNFWGLLETASPHEWKEEQVGFFFNDYNIMEIYHNGPASLGHGFSSFFKVKNV